MSYGPAYVVSFTGLSYSAQLDAFEVVAAADAILEVLGWRLGQTTEQGDAEAEQLLAEFITGHTTSGSGGSAATPRPLQTGFPAAGFTAETGNTTIASLGTPITKAVDAWNVQIGSIYVPTPEERIILSPSARGVLRLEAPADPMTLQGELRLREMGG